MTCSSITSGQTSADCSAVVVEMVYVGAETHYTLRAGEQTLRAELMNSPESEALFVGQKAWLRLPPAALVVLDE